MKDKSNPNIILILADDMGFSDLGCFGSEINTPNIDALSQSGVIFTQAYNSARCCPSRASLLTGLNPHQAGIGHMTANLGHSSYQGYLNKNCVTIAEALKLSGYNTALSGKWHVGGHYDPRYHESSLPVGDEEHPTPTQRGFDKFYGSLLGGGSYYNPKVLLKNEKFVKPEGDRYHFTDAVTDEAIYMIEDFAKEDGPFFLHLSYTAPHWPLHAFEEDVSKYEGKYMVGWDKIRQNRYENLKGLGIINPKWDISPRDENSYPWEMVKYKKWEDRRMAVYAAQVEHMDRSIGKIIKKLKDLNLYNNTLIIFLSDNGGCAEFLAEDTSEPTCDLYNFATRDGRDMKIGNNPNIMPSADDTFQSYELPWANASNSFRLYKRWLHEGGISTPLIISWPEFIKNKSMLESPVYVADIMTTCLDVVKGNYPSEYNGNSITPSEGESLLPALDNRNWSRQNPICWEHEGNRSIRDGRWKMVSKYPGKWKLYDMIEDRTNLLERINQKYHNLRNIIKTGQRDAVYKNGKMTGMFLK
jgi:arylsulfatase A-like enzyme